MNLKKLTLAVASAAVLAGMASPAAAVPAIWEPSFGATVGSGDDSIFAVAFGFAFPFVGSSHAGGEVSTNGFLSLGGSNGSGCCDGNVGGLLSGAARIAPAWYDQVHTVFLNTSVAGRAVITWQGVEFSNSLPVLYQAQLFSDGRIIFGYDTLPPLENTGHRHDAVTGVSLGSGSPNPGEIDYTTALPFDSGTSNTVYEFFARGPNGATGGNPDTFDLAQRNICFSPNNTRGWSVNNCAETVPEPGSLPLAFAALTLVAGLGAAAKRARNTTA